MALQSLTQMDVLDWVRNIATDADFESVSAFKTAIMNLADVPVDMQATTEFPPYILTVYWREGASRAMMAGRR